jgi:hypothetical protein
MRTFGYLTAVAAALGVGEALVAPNRFENPEERPQLNKGGLVKRVRPHDAAFPAHCFQQKVSVGHRPAQRGRPITV